MVVFDERVGSGVDRLARKTVTFPYSVVYVFTTLIGGKSLLLFSPSSHEHGQVWAGKSCGKERWRPGLGRTRRYYLFSFVFLLEFGRGGPG